MAGSEVIVNDQGDATVIQIQEGEQSTELIADAIERIAAASEDLLATGLQRRALVVLLQDSIGAGAITRRAINEVLDALPLLRLYLDDEADG